MAAGHCDAALVGASIGNDIAQAVSHSALKERKKRMDGGPVPRVNRYRGGFHPHKRL